MGKPKLRPLPAILKLVESLSEDERADLRDYLRPAPKPRQKVRGGGKTAQKRKAGREAQPDEVRSELDQPCVNCTYDFDNNVHHKRTDPGYHEFQPAGEASKGVGA